MWQYTKKELDELLDGFALVERAADKAHERYWRLCKIKSQLNARIQHICSHNEGQTTEIENHSDTFGKYTGYSVHHLCNLCKKKIRTDAF